MERSRVTASGGGKKTCACLVQFPDCYEAAVIKMVHYATLKEEDLSQRVVSYFKDRFVAGEVVLVRREGKQTPCTVVAAVDPTCATHDCTFRSVVQHLRFGRADYRSKELRGLFLGQGEQVSKQGRCRMRRQVEG